jgi:hypothetical protein
MANVPQVTAPLLDSTKIALPKRRRVGNRARGDLAHADARARGFPPYTTLRALAVLLVAALAGCATGYGEMGLTGGYKDKIVEPGIAVVVVGGNGFTGEAKVEAIAKMRAAELTLAQGFSRFSLFTIEDQAAADALKANRLGAYLRDKAAHESGGPDLNSKTTTVYSNGVVIPIKRYGGGLFVVMSKSGGTYDAAKVVAELRPRLAPTASEAPVAPSDVRQ